MKYIEKFYLYDISIRKEIERERENRLENERDGTNLFIRSVSNMNTLPDTLTALMSSMDPRTLYLVNGLPFTKIYQVTEMIS